jgi:hypothetical protein
MCKCYATETAVDTSECQDSDAVHACFCNAVRAPTDVALGRALVRFHQLDAIAERIVYIDAMVAFERLIFVQRIS